jgi:hypothetical protein
MVRCVADGGMNRRDRIIGKLVTEQFFTGKARLASIASTLANVQMGIRKFKAEMNNKVRKMGVFERVTPWNNTSFVFYPEWPVGANSFAFCGSSIGNFSASFSVIAKCQYNEMGLHALRDYLHQI